MITVHSDLRNSSFDWPEFERRLEESNHNGGTAEHGSRTGDIVLVMNGAQGFMAVLHGEDMLKGWHGGPEKAESEVPLMFSMPGPDLLVPSDTKEPPFVLQAYNAVTQGAGWVPRNWRMGSVINEIVSQVRTPSDP